MVWAVAHMEQDILKDTWKEAVVLEAEEIPIKGTYTH